MSVSLVIASLSTKVCKFFRAVKKIYLNSDGGAWIKFRMKRIAGITYELDKFHLKKYLTKFTSHMRDSREDTANELRAAIKSKI